MKISRLSALFLATLLASASAQDNGDLAVLRAKAENGNGIAQYNLGLAYAEGRGTPTDSIAAYLWLSLARENGARGRALDTLVASLDRATLATAQQQLAHLRATLPATTPKPLVPAPEETTTAPKITDPEPTPLPTESTPAVAEKTASNDALTLANKNLRALQIELSQLKSQAFAESQHFIQDREALASRLAVATTAQAALTEQLTQRARENTALTEQLATAEATRQATLLNAQEQIKKLAAEKDTLAVENAHAGELHTQALTLKKSLVSAQTQISTLAAERDTAQAQAEAWHHSLSQLEQEKAQLTTALASATQAVNELTTAQDHVTQLEKDLQAETTRRAAVEKTLSETAEKLARLAQTKTAAEDTAQTRQVELQTNLDRLTQENIRLTAAGNLSIHNGHLAAELKDKVAAAEQQTQALRQERDALLAKLSDFANEVAQLRGDHETIERQLAEAEARPSPAPAYPDLTDQVHALETQLATTQQQAENATQHATIISRQSTADLQLATARLKELEAELTAAKQPAVPAYPDLAGRVAELETQTGELETALVAAQNATHCYPDLSAQVRTLENQKADLASKLATLSRPNDPAPDLSGKVSELEATLADTSRQLATSTAAQTELQTQLTTATTALAQAQHHDETTRLKREREELTERVTELASEVAALRNDRERTQKLLADTGNKLRDAEAAAARAKEREAELAAAHQPVAPAYPNLTERVAELESQTATLSTSLAAAQAQAGGLLSERDTARAAQHELREIITRLTAEKTPPADTVPAPDTADWPKRLADTEDRLATALRSYTLLEKDHAALLATVQQTREALTAEKESLAAKLNEAEARAANAQAEVIRLNESFEALQRSTAQGATELAAAQSLLQQMQGSNTVLATENYQLKAMLARSTGAAAPAPTMPTAPAPRSHVVIAGDSLSKISETYYGNAKRWPEIYQANREKLGSTGTLRVGTELRIP